MAKLRIKWVKSSIGYPQDQKDTIRVLGLRKLQQTVEHEDQPSIRGMIRKVNHLVQVLPIRSPEPEASSEKSVGDRNKKVEETISETV